MNRLLLTSILLCLGALAPASGKDKNIFKANIVLFVKDGQDVPKSYEERLQTLGLRTEAFLTFDIFFEITTANFVSCSVVTK